LDLDLASADDVLSGLKPSIDFGSSVVMVIPELYLFFDKLSFFNLIF
jgi:hypothetical protein